MRLSFGQDLPMWNEWFSLGGVSKDAGDYSAFVMKGGKYQLACPTNT
jgi:hypothetical protein